MPFNLRPHLEHLLAGRDLTQDHAAEIMAAMVEGDVSHASIAAFAIALRVKGETADELAGLASAMRSHAVKISAPVGAIDTCGTGGDSSSTFNISTAAALVVAGMGVHVAKHGGRASSSTTGSADVLKALGVNIDLAPSGVERCLQDAGIGFLFAQTFHPGMKHVAPVRKELGVRTVFNLLGPLSNPAGATHQLLGVSKPEQCELFARVLQKLGSQRAMIVCGTAPGTLGFLDEISTFGPTTIARLQDGVIKVVTLDAAKLGVPSGDLKSMQVANADESAAMIREILDGKKSAARDIVVLNAAAAAQVSGKAQTWMDGLKMAGESVDSGAAKNALKRLVDASHAH